MVARIEKTGTADTEEEDNSSMERRKKRLKDPPPTSITESDLKPMSKTSTLASDTSKKPAARKPKKQKSPDKKKLSKTRFTRSKQASAIPAHLDYMNLLDDDKFAIDYQGHELVGALDLRAFKMPGTN